LEVMTAATDTNTAGKSSRFDRDIDGILLFDKPVGVSSNRALQQVRALFRAAKAGHAGSLDPMASGMLPVCFGQATKVCAFLLDSYKSYRFTAKLGERTDTGDADGQVVERQAVPPLTEQALSAVLHANLGSQLQVPPMYSALKHQGRRLYELARQGQEVERAARPINIAQLTLLGFSQSHLDVEVRCSKGTYVRTLAEGLATQLGTLAHLTALRRLQVDPFPSRVYDLVQLQDHAARGLADLDALLLPSDRALPHLPAAAFDPRGVKALLAGQSAAPVSVAKKLAEEQGMGQSDSNPGPTAGDWVRMYVAPEFAAQTAGHFLGLGQISPGGEVQPRRLLVKSA
jgi:tRNA pseudouridine55 synthase